MKRLISCCLLVLSPYALAAEDASCKNVRMGVVNWTDVIATSAMAQTLLDGLGYKTKQTSASQQIIFAGLRDKRLDMFLGYWNPIMNQSITPFVDAKQVTVLAEPSLKDAKAMLAVPTYMADKGLKSFADIATFEKELGGRIYGIEPGSGANTQIKAMIEKNQFGLGKFQLVESSEAGMLSAVTRAVKRNEPIVFFGWTPHPMNINQDMTYLTGSEDALGPDEGRATVWTVTAPDYASRCPNVSRLLSNLTFSAEDESRMMQPLLDHKDAQASARQWLKDHPQDQQRWLEGVTTVDGKPAAGNLKLSAK
ncbi:choline ABC transporter substrate-binding protein [Pseudomonas sp. FSL R10-0056]|jgi:choline ABC transporter, periplasmic binding protein|uniref:choline ABC transporter substrate-binding protein n=1 Tax=Pseudomonas TaxID=286 RepID=UPI000BA1DE37|nr:MULTISPECIES: choline ABC transporter substrate-binding protein [Pseudomonas]MBP3860520.1 choline ABC transporter substrate-binding protein [Pseudomonas sp.]MCH4884328.1 choline ABC transporter substrate-binding protein [Pseudomonas sp. TMW22080]MDN5408108.1 choline ABC transporter substrate-binding protein [Pseudomonas sp.]MDN5448420.1 choline ABC transporter substrate-binding protein [Pseudomonas sp.]MDN5454957.1 choline ABC transporter substrate-binding protein [Pseudomonas sp.]